MPPQTTTECKKRRDIKCTYMSTQHCGLTAPVESTTVYLFGAVHSTEKEEEIRLIISMIYNWIIKYNVKTIID